MIFNELYSAYYNTVAKIISEILNKGLTSETLYKIIEDNAFSESVLNVIPAIKQERWQIITKNYKTPIKHKPTMPLTLLQKRWLKAIFLDEKIKLFDIKVDFLDDVEPLFTKNDYTVFDKYLDGDDYSSQEYVKKFKFILNATKNKLPINVEVINRSGKIIKATFIVEKIEYSEKDDKFRIITYGSRWAKVVNIAKIINYSLYEGRYKIKKASSDVKKSTVTMIVNDELNALERTMLHFAHFEKQVEKIDDKTYKVTINYETSDENEMVIRILSFGSQVKVIEPSSFVQLIKNKLKKQQNCELK
ncbi:MAG: WYL domain-containing protein [Clostridia bacterium]|nr:WYL domain-containing protein [Clostridia bacterium]